MVDLRLLPPSIQDERFKAYLENIERLATLPLESLLIYAIDTVDSSALIHLADQFNVLGNRGWNLCDNEQQQRDLIKAAIELHRYAGTPYSIQRALSVVGFGDSTIDENPPFYYDGGVIYGGGGYFKQTAFYNGDPVLYDGATLAGGILTPANEFYDGRFWGAFSVFLDLGKKGSTQQQLDLVRELILEWKNVRSHLLEVGFRRDLLPYSGIPIQTYDGEPLFGGAILYSNYTIFYNGVEDFDGDLNN